MKKLFYHFLRMIRYFLSHVEKHMMLGGQLDSVGKRFAGRVHMLA